MTPEEEVKLIAMVKQHEGFRSRIYVDSEGFRTIGYGHNCDSHSDVEKFGDREITLEEAEELLMQDLQDAIHECAKVVKSFFNLSGIQQAVLIDMMFNLGPERLKRFKKMLSAVTVGYRKEIARQMIDSRWCSQVGKRATELVYMTLTQEWL